MNSRRETETDIKTMRNRYIYIERQREAKRQELRERKKC